MIYTVTLNPAIDYVIHVDKLKPNSIMRGDGEQIFFGGKGINVSVILKELGTQSIAMGYVAGFTGMALEQGLANMGIKSDFIHLQNGFTRINVKIRSEKETDINCNGPDIAEGEFNKLTDKLFKLESGDTLVMAGSIPKSMPNDVYERIMSGLADKNVRFVVDATGELLLNSLKYKPFLIKPNSDELSEIFGDKIKSMTDIEKYAEKLQEMGAVNVLVSLGHDGAFLIDENKQRHFMKPYDGDVVNTVGSGDSMVAGFIAGYEKTGNYGYALKLGTASGSATAFCEGLSNIKIINELMENGRQA